VGNSRGEHDGVCFETYHAYDYRFEQGRFVESCTIPTDQRAANAFSSS
jgi:hypothetical protein